ncbi:MAG: hypothetical protein AAGI51_03625, partial [Pseudomonadota bacterium]
MAAARKSEKRRRSAVALGLVLIFVFYLFGIRFLPAGKSWLDLLQALVVPSAVLVGAGVAYLNFLLAEKKRED